MEVYFYALFLTSAVGMVIFTCQPFYNRVHSEGCREWGVQVGIREEPVAIQIQYVRIPDICLIPLCWKANVCSCLG